MKTFFEFRSPDINFARQYRFTRLSQVDIDLIIGIEEASNLIIEGKVIKRSLIHLSNGSSIECVWRYQTLAKRLAKALRRQEEEAYRTIFSQRTLDSECRPVDSIYKRPAESLPDNGTKV